MNGFSTSQCSSRCEESGWTMYLDQSASQNHCKRYVGFSNEDYKTKENEQQQDECEEEEEEDLSMVSDASSGPPHFHEDEDCFDENGCSCFSPSAASVLSTKKNTKRQKIKDQIQQNQQNLSLLDDTASSPIFSFSKINNQQPSMENVLDFSQGFSATHYKRRSTFQKQHFGFMESNLPGNNFSKTNDLKGRKWG